MSRYPIFDALHAAKVFLSMRGDKLNVRPSKLVAPALAEMIRANKTELVDMLSRSADLPPCERCEGPQIAVRTFDHYENAECMPCGVCSGCRPIGNGYQSMQQELFSGGASA